MEISSVSLSSFKHILTSHFSSDIDFGHILGNFKSKAGFKRERAAFVFTPEMAYIVGGKKKNYKQHVNYIKFIELSLKSFQAIRDNDRLWVALFKLVSSPFPKAFSQFLLSDGSKLTSRANAR
jgi:hypothetical protein